MNSIVIVNTVINQDADGRYCLNDLHRAAGGISRHKPANFLRLASTRALQAEIDRCSEVSSAISVAGGTVQGTFVSKELVYAYAMWISPKFCLKVIRAYDSMVTAELTRLNSLHHRAVRAELEFIQGMESASRCGLGLRRWQNEKPEIQQRLMALQEELQPSLLTH